jgi:hypothetical protein
MSPPHWSTSQELRRNQQGARALYYAHVRTSILEHTALVAGLCDGRRGACAKSARRINVKPSSITTQSKDESHERIR